MAHPFYLTPTWRERVAMFKCRYLRKLRGWVIGYLNSRAMRRIEEI